MESLRTRLYILEFDKKLLLVETSARLPSRSRSVFTLLSQRAVLTIRSGDQRSGRGGETKSKTKRAEIAVEEAKDGCLRRLKVAVQREREEEEKRRVSIVSMEAEFSIFIWYM